jgi:hypothetical protein
VEPDSLEQRIIRLERQCRRWRRAGIVFAVLVGIPVLATLIAFLIHDETREAQRLVILDKQRRIVMDLGTWSDGTPRLLLAGQSGTPRMELSVGKDEVPGIELLDGDRNTRLSMTVEKTGPTLKLTDKNGVARLVLILAEKGEPSVSLLDGKGKFRAHLSVDADNSVHFGIADSAEQVRLGLGVQKDGLPGLGLLDKDGKLRFEISLEKDGNPILTRPKTSPDSEKTERAKPFSDRGSSSQEQRRL